MRISTKGRYAIQIMLDLAIYNTGEPVSLRDIAKRLDASEKYLEQIISMLNKGGLVKSVRGSSGGYFLSTKPEEITVGMILRITEGELSSVDKGDAAENDKIYHSVTMRFWDELDSAINSVIDRVTIADMLLWYEESMHNYSI